MAKQNPWRGFLAEGPALTVLRAERLPLGRGTQGKPSCEAWLSALSAGWGAQPIGGGDWQKSWIQATRAWSPWRKEDAKAVTECSQQPCQAKLNDAEVEQMAAVEEPVRMSTYLSLVSDRVSHYQSTQERLGYEFPGKPVDPWQRFEALGLKSQSKRPEQGELWIRKVDLTARDPGKMREIRQVMDQRMAVAQDRKSATLWRRDAYTDHYFDSWGEWIDVRCDTGAQVVWVTQALLLEVDLLKKKDLVSQVMRSKLRAAIEEHGAHYLDDAFERMKKKAAL